MMRYRNTGTRSSADGGTNGNGPQTPGAQSAPGSGKNWSMGGSGTPTHPLNTPSHQVTSVFFIIPSYLTHQMNAPCQLYTLPTPNTPHPLMLTISSGAGIAGGGGGAVQGILQTQSGGQGLGQGTGSKYPALGNVQGMTQGQGAGGQGPGAAYSTSASNYNAAMMAQQVRTSFQHTLATNTLTQKQLSSRHDDNTTIISIITTTDTARKSRQCRRDELKTPRRQW